MKRLAILIAFLLPGLLVRAQAFIARPAKQWSQPNYNAQYKGKEYTSFDLVTLDGQAASNAVCKGKAVFLTFWFEGCAGCRQEFAELNELYDSLKNDSHCRFVAVTYDDAAILPPFIKEHNLRYPIATTGSSDILHRLNYGMACPSIIILDKEGRILHAGNNSITSGNAASPYEMTIKEVLAIIRKAE